MWSLKICLVRLTHLLAFSPTRVGHVLFFLLQGEHGNSKSQGPHQVALPTSFSNAHSARDLASPLKSQRPHSPTPKGFLVSFPPTVPGRGSLLRSQRAIVTCRGRSGMLNVTAPLPTFVFWFMHSRPRQFCSLWWRPVQSRHHRDILISSALVISELLFLSGNT